MKRLLPLLVSGICAVSISLAQFEGIVETRNLTTDEAGMPQQFKITMWIKSDRVRVQSTAFGSSPASTMIYRSDRKVTWMLNEDERTYFEILQKTQPSPERPYSGEELHPTISRTGKTRKVLGYPCEQVLVKRENEETVIWGTKSLASLSVTIRRVLGEPETGAPGGWQEQLDALGLYALSASTRIEGALVEQQETTKIEKREVASGLFELPAGYRKQDIGEMSGEIGK
jgi:hypothetical protein